MKKNILIIMLLAIVASAFKPVEKDYSLCKVHTFSNKPVFFYNTPANTYTTSFSYSAIIPFPRYINTSHVADESMRAASTEAGYQNRLFDAIIVTNGSERDLAIQFTDKSKDITLANAPKIEGKYVFIEADPVNEYDIVGKYTINAAACKKQGTPQNVKTLKHQLLIAKIIKKAGADKLDFDAVIYGEGKNDLVIKFK